MAPITHVLCLYVLSLGVFVWSTGARESRFFNKEPAYDNPNGGSNNAGYGEGYTNSGVDNSYGDGSGNGYGSYRGQGNGNGYVYGDSDVSRFSSGDGRAGNGYRSGSGRAAEYFSQSAVGNDAGAGYKESSGKGSGYAAGAGYRGEAYGSGSGSGSGADWHGYNGGYAQGGDQYASGHGRRTESNGPYRSAYGSGYFTGSHNVLSDSQPPYMCNDQASTYADGSTFSSNLNRVMGDLVNNTPQTGFNTSSYGQNLNRIYGLLQCAGDISEQSCSTCSQKANETVRQLCPHKIGGRLWLDNCYLPYENFNFSARLNTYLFKRLVSSSNISSGDINSFTTTTSNLLFNLSYEAYNFTKKGFAQGSARYSVNGTVYGEVQCWRYLSITDCKSCLQIAINNVSDDYSMSRGALLGSCLVRYEIYPFIDTSSASPPPTSAPSGANPPTVAAPLANGTSSTMSNGFSSKTLPIIMGIVGGVLLVLMACLFAIWRKMKSSISERRGTRLQNEETRESDPEPTQLKQTQTLFTVEDLIEATDNFDKNKKLGQGGFGSVYKGTTRDGIEIAVKKLSVTSGQGKREFMNEVKLVANVQHRNLVKLLGCCAEGRERLLVYEYLPNKSLDSFLFDPKKKRQRHLDWHKRYNIITGIARGLLYLHQDSQLRIIHRDIKASNILLDERLNPKIADFGLARLFPEDETHIQTTKIAGTYGYMAPEYAMRGKLSVKVDVYSFGVLVLEIVSGRKNTELNFPDEMQSLLEWAWRLYNRGCLPDMIDSTLAETIRQEQALRCIHVALLCTQADAGLRPIMSNVILMISSAPVTLANPTMPAFVNNSDSGHGGSTAGSSSSGIQQSRPSATASSVSPASTYSPLVPSINDVTISELDAR